MVHAVGPDLRRERYTGVEGKARAIAELTQVYSNVLRECVKAERAKEVRLLPISGAIFVGKFSEPDIFAKMTEKA